MGYQSYLIANYATGLDKRLQPWLIPDDAQEQLYDGYVYRGVMSKRPGYSYFATGGQGGTPYTESRIVHHIAAFATGQTNTGAVLADITLSPIPVRRGTVVVTDGTTSIMDNGLGAFPSALAGAINYTTGVIMGFQFPAASGMAVTVNFDFFPGNPVMMEANFITASDVRQLIVADTQYVNRYNSATNRLDDISPLAPFTGYTGNKFNFFSWVNYPPSADTARLLFCNNKDVIQQYDGANVTDYAYTPGPITTLTALLMFQMRDRLVLLRTTENGTVFPRRIRVSGFGTNADNFNDTATGAGFYEISDGSWIMGAAFNRDDLIIFTQSSTWVLQWTGNDADPFQLKKIDESRGSEAPFGAITYLNRTSALSPRGLIISDGYRVERQDEDIPDFSFNEIDGSNFALCFAGFVDEDRDHYLLYPPPDQTAGTEVSKRILTTNYDEDNYAIYRMSLSSMGTYVTAFDITWNDLTAENGYPNWDAFASVYGDWNSFAYTSGAPFSIGGGQKGEIWRLNVTGIEDNPVMIRDITIIDAETIEVTTDWNNYSLNLDDQDKGADTIQLTGVGGMQEVNNQQYPIDSITNNNVFRLRVPPDANLFTAYTSGGVAQRVIPFSATFKKFNPFVQDGKKVRCGWIYMYVDASTTDLTRNIQIVGATNANPCVITTNVAHNLQTNDQVSIFGVAGMTQLNGNVYFITVVTPTTFFLNGIDSTAFGTYTSGGYAAVSEKVKAIIEIITNDNNKPTQLDEDTPFPYEGTVSNLSFEAGTKKWYKLFVNQVGTFIQFRIKNLQAGAEISIHATMPGFQPVGRII